MQLFALLAAAFLAVIFLAVASARSLHDILAPAQGKPFRAPGGPVRALPARAGARKAGMVADSEFSEELAPQVTAPGVRGCAPPSEYSIPSRYGENRVALMVRDPHWLYAYWEIQPELERARVRESGIDLSETVPVLRLYDITDGRCVHQDIRLTEQSDSWYLNIAAPAHTYYAEVGRLSRTGRFVPMARSNVVSTPPAGVSELVAHDWLPIGWRAFRGGAAPSSPEFLKKGGRRC